MLRNYFKIAYRNLRANRAFTLINVFGLAIGLATCMLMMLYIFDERSYDAHQQYGDRVYRIVGVNNKGESWAAEAAPLAWTVKSDLPEVEQVTRLMTFPDIATMLIRYDEGQNRKQFFESKGYYVDSTFFQLLTYDFIYGNSLNALVQPNSIVLSRTMAQRFFGDRNPVNKPLVINTPFGEFNYTVQGVFDDRNNKSHIPANYFLSMRNSDMWNWVQRQTSLVGNNVFYTYVKLKPTANAAQFEQKMATLFNRKAGPDMKASGFSLRLFLQPLKSIYLHSDMPNEIGVNGNITYLYILGSIAAFILLIACINFMNLSTARSEKRAKEVGVRKVLGAERSSLIIQFIGESLMLCAIALLIAFGVAQLLLPLFNMLTGKHVSLYQQPSLIVCIAGLTLLAGLLAGLYPALYLSAFKPAGILKGKLVNHFSAVAIRKGLVIFQFAISVTLVLAAMVVWKQLRFMQSQSLGFNKTQKLILPLQQGYLNSEEHYTALKNELRKYPEINAVSSGSAYPGATNLNDMLFFAEGKTKSETVDVHLAAVEKDYLETLGFHMLSGRTFNNDFNGDSASIILNEAAVKQLGYTSANAIGRKIQFDVNGYTGTMLVVGVVKNFNFESLHHQIQPYGFTTRMFSNRFGFCIADLTTDNYAAVLKKIETAWIKLNPGVPFVYSFLDQDFQSNYEKEQRSSAMVTYFTIIAIVIACLGLFGLAAFAAEQRTREIGIRKVLGASVSQVTVLLSKDFLVLVAVAVCIASPVAWWVMNKWLQAFAYKTTIAWWMFVAAAAIAVVIALATISFQSIKAAMANPVKSLRSE